MLILNLLFLFIVSFMSIALVKAYYNTMKSKKIINYSNPLNLTINDAYFQDRNLLIILENPNNYTVSFYVESIGVRNSFGSACPITSGGDIRNIITLQSFSRATPSFYVPPDCDKVLIPFKAGRAYLNLSVYYRDMSSQRLGVLRTVIRK